jgi:hypothetical protein
VAEPSLSGGFKQLQTTANAGVASLQPLQTALKNGRLAFEQSMLI